jgi:FtsP/CotA-like multicopper oxidase with cupredoxin domain
MAGMVLGVTVVAPPGDRVADDAKGQTPRRLALGISQRLDANGKPVGAGFVLTEGDGKGSDRVTAPGPPLVLRRGEPVEITLLNQLSEATAIHWHGMELDSYYDGVHGWSGIGQRVAPMIEPGARFVVRFTPPRAGTFIYHTHLHDYRQLSSGLYGPLIVIDPGETFDPRTDHVVVLGRNDVTSEAASILRDPQSVVMNGERAPRFVWNAGQRHRLRFINITPDDIFVVSLQAGDALATWKLLTKDGALVPPADSTPGPARQAIAVGETYDFEYEAPQGRRTLWLEVRSTGGKWQAQGSVVVR